MVRVDADYSATPFKAKISNAEQLRVHTMLAIGQRELEQDNVAARLHDTGDVGVKPSGEAVADILASIRKRRAQVGLSVIFCPWLDVFWLGIILFKPGRDLVSLRGLGNGAGLSENRFPSEERISN